MTTNTHQPPTAIVFDLGGVLIDWNPRYLYDKMFNGDEAKITYFLNTVCPQEWNEKQDAGYPFAKAIAERIELFPDYAPYIQAFFDRWIEMIGGEITETVEILSRLRQQGYPLYALSNWAAETFAIAHANFDFLKWFKIAIISGQEKLMKPDLAIYHRLLDRIEHPPHECLFIDDTKINIIAAQQLGFQTHHFTSPANLLAALQARKILH